MHKKFDPLFLLIQIRTEFQMTKTTVQVSLIEIIKTIVQILPTMIKKILMETEKVMHANQHRKEVWMKVSKKSRQGQLKKLNVMIKRYLELIKKSNHQDEFLIGFRLQQDFGWKKM